MYKVFEFLVGKMKNEQQPVRAEVLRNISERFKINYFTYEYTSLMDELIKNITNSIDKSYEIDYVFIFIYKILIFNKN
jgi:hypothetical protein